MPRFTFPAAIGLVALWTSIASAGFTHTPEATGTVRTWSPTTSLLVLSNGDNFVMPAAFSNPRAFWAGEKVRLSYKFAEGRNVVTQVIVLH